MVRVFKCHSFKAARVIPVVEEPLAVYADGDLVFVATRQCSILIYKQDEGGDNFSEWRSLNTINTVEMLTYNKLKNYIVTLEQKRSWKNISKFVRVYLNWHHDVLPNIKQKTKVRMAGKAHSLHSSGNYIPQLEVVELMIDGIITALDVCKWTGNFAIACGREVKLFHVIEKTVANSDMTYKDVEPFLELCWNFEISSLSLSEEYLVGCSHNEVQVISILYADVDDGSPCPLSRARSAHMVDKSVENSSRQPISKQNRQQLQFPLDDTSVPSSCSESSGQESTSASFEYVSRSSSAHSSILGIDANNSGTIVNDKYFQEWSFGAEYDVDEDCEDSSRHQSKTVYLQSLHSGSPYPDQKAHPPLLRDVRGGPVKSSSGVSAKTLLYLHEMKEQDDWLAVTLISSHVPDPDFEQLPSPSWTGHNPVLSPFLLLRCSVCCYISSYRGGYLYWLNPKVALVSTYRYTDIAYKVVAGPHLLEVITRKGLETYTARWGLLALSVKENTGEEEDRARPPSDLDICLCGIEPFFGAVDLSIGNNIVALLTRLPAHKGQEDTSWNLYALQRCSLAEFYKDMVMFASRIQETGPASYHHLLQEAHLLLRWEMRQHATVRPELLDLFQESCALLGDFYSLPKQEDWHLCLPYYQRSGMSVSDIVRQGLQHKQHSREQTSVYVFGRGLIQYLDWALFESHIQVDLKQDICNAVLNIYSHSCPDALPSLILFSQLQNYSPETALRLLSELFTLKESRNEKSSTKDRLALVKIHILLCDLEAAETELSALDKGEVIDICASHPGLIQMDTEFTPLGQFLRRHSSSSVLKLLAELLSRGPMSMDCILQLLEKGTDLPRYKNNQVREFLETVLSDKKRRFWFEEAAALLAEIYIQRLVLGSDLQPQRQIRSSPLKFLMPAANGHFAVRFPWLDYLPPIHSPLGLSRPCLHITVIPPGNRVPTMSPPVQVTGISVRGHKDDTDGRCSCSFCIQDLLKLQSLMCSHEATESLKDQVLSLIKNIPDMIGWDSIWMLCSCSKSPKDATEFIVDRCPQAAAKFAVSSFGLDGEKWQCLLRCLEGRVKEQSANSVSVACSLVADEGQQVIVTAYQDVLGEMVELFPPEVFLMALPGDGSLWFLLPFITRSLQNKHLKELKNTIVSKGEAILSQLHAV